MRLANETTRPQGALTSAAGAVFLQVRAVEVGFEPTDELPHHTLSRRAPSATRRLHRRRAYLSDASVGRQARAAYRRSPKNSRSTAAHSSASTPLTTSTG